MEVTYEVYEAKWEANTHKTLREIEEGKAGFHSDANGGSESVCGHYHFNPGDVDALWSANRIDSALDEVAEHIATFCMFTTLEEAVYDLLSMQDEAVFEARVG